MIVLARDRSCAGAPQGGLAPARHMDPTQLRHGAVAPSTMMLLSELPNDARLPATVAALRNGALCSACVLRRRLRVTRKKCLNFE
jgi:hypothetical protein